MKIRKNGILFFLCTIFFCWMALSEQTYAKENDSLTIDIHYFRDELDYQGWNLWIWVDDEGGQEYRFKVSDEEAYAELSFDNIGENAKIGMIVRKNDWEEKDVEVDRFLDLSQVKDGKLTVWLWQGEEEIHYGSGIRIVDASLETEKDIKVTMFMPEKTESSLCVEDKDGIEYEIDTQTFEINGYISSGSIQLKEKVSLPNTYYLISGNEKYAIRFGGIYDTDTFKRKFEYKGEDLGVTCSEKESIFCLWSPMAEEVTLLLYQEGTSEEPLQSIPLNREKKGVWRVTLEGDYRNKYYTYLVNVQGSVRETVDPYAKSTGLNGQKGFIFCSNEVSPQGFDEDTFIKNVDREDVILYEMSVRDYTSNEASGVLAKGKFMGLTEENAINSYGDSTGLSYLSELGVTHVHLLPIQDFEGVDESVPEDSYNWGYNPVNYFVPEGSYSTDPYHGEVRVEECKKMVQSLHSKNIGVVLDVVFNHTYYNSESAFEKIVPGYYYRMDENGNYSNGSACGNELATERTMVRKYIIDCVKYWMEEYHVDGFRFDLMGLIDVETMQKIQKEVYRINPHAVLYGEGWDAGETVYEGERMESTEAYQTSKIGTFNNVFRRAVQKYVCGIMEEDSTVLGMQFGFVGAGDNTNTIDRMGSWTDNPIQCINYATCHDGYTLWDLITLSCPTEDEEMWKQRDKFGAACVLLCQGTPFLHSGEEILRTKTSENNPDVKYSNSYNAGDYVNSIAWDNRTENQDVLEYYKGLIAFRKEHEGLHYKTERKLNNNLVFIEGLPENVMGYYVSEGESLFVDRQICLLFNPTGEDITYVPKAGEWEVYVNAKQAGTQMIETVASGEELCVEKASALVAVREVVRTDRIVMIVVILLAMTTFMFYIRGKRGKGE